VAARALGLRGRPRLVLRDLWPSAGWGLVDAAGAPKAAYYAVKRALQPIALHVKRRGRNGLALHLVNERPEPLRGELEVALYARARSPWDARAVPSI